MDDPVKEKPLTYTPPEKFSPFTPEEQRLLVSVSRRASNSKYRSYLGWWVSFCKQIKAQGYISVKQRELLENFNVEKEVQKSMDREELRESLASTSDLY